MRVFVYTPDTESIDPAQIALRRDRLTKEQCNTFVDAMCFRSGQSVQGSWIAPPMVLRFDKSTNAALPEACDFPVPYDSGSLVMSQRAAACLRAVLGAAGELLPLECDVGSYWIMNVTNIIDAVDPDRSEWLQVEGQSPLLWRPAFMQDVVGENLLFRLPAKYKKSQTYFTQRFVDEVNKHGLSGFDARTVWSSG